MNTLTKSFAKRALSILLVAIMLFSLGIVGITSTSAVNADLVDIGYDPNGNIYCLNSFSQGTDQSKWTDADEVKMTKTGVNTLKITFDNVPTSDDFKFIIHTPNEGHYLQGGTVATPNMNSNYKLNHSPTTIISSATPFTVSFVNVKNTYSSVNMEIYFYTNYNNIEVKIVSGSTSGGNTGGDATGTVPGVLYLDTTFWDDVNSVEDYVAVFTVGSSTTTVNKVFVDTNLYSFTVPDGATKVNFQRLDAETGAKWNYTATMAIPTNGNDMFTVKAWNNGTTIWSKYVPANSFTDFWVDTNANIPYANDAVDILVPYFKDGGDTYYLYLPSGADADKLKFYAAHDGVSVNGTAISTTGTEVKVTADGKTVHTLAGATVTKLVVFKSTASALYTKTDEAMPIKPGYDTLKGEGIHKDDYETENVKTENADGTVTNSQFYAMANPDGSLVADKKKNTVPVLKKVKGRGNSSWKASQQLFGKYAFNITLGDSSDLVGNDDTMSKKYCLISYNADEARMRNMLVYSLSQEIGLNFIADYKPVDLYNNNRYIGSYLLTDKVEIGDPLVEIVNLDEINEKLYGDSYGDDIYRACINNYDLDETSAPGFDKYYDYSRLGKDDVDKDVYAQSGFLLEFENYDRFAAEMAGFISWRGQQIVCKYPEYPSKAQLQFIESKWNTIEYKLYTEDLDYDTLSQYIDVESFAKMYLIQELTKNVDAGATSYYVYYHNGKFNAGVSWDYDWALGQYALNRTLVKGNTKFPATNSTALSNPQGWWASIKGIYTGFNTVSNEYNFQAKLCQNNAFWKVVLAEWNENFKPIIDGYVVNSANTSTPANLSGKKIHEFYDQVHASTLMDESRWGFIAADKMGTNGEEGSWGSKDTGDTHDDTTVWLNDFVYDRVTWMNNSGLNATDYTIQPPVLSFATDMPEDGFTVGTTVTINIDDVTDGSYEYTIFKNGTKMVSTTNKSFEVTAESGDVVYTVMATAKTSGKSSKASADLTVTGKGYAITPSLKASSTTVLTGDTVTLTTSISEDYTGVTYEIYYKADGGESQLLSGTKYTQNTAGEVEFYVVATATVEGETITASTESTPVKVTFSEFSISLSATGEGTVMQSQNLTITATPNIQDKVTYTFYKDDVVITGFENVTINSITEKMDDAGSFVYKVVANYAGKTAEATITVTVKEFDGTFTVKVLFKSSTVGAYRPNMKVNGTLVTLTEETAIEVDKVGDGISTYRWFSYTLPEDQTYGTPITVEVEGNRDYFYKASYSFEVGNTEYPYDSADGFTSYYLALDNLNKRGGTLSNLSGLEAYVRNWTQSATHMIYNDKYDGELSAPVGFSFRYADYGDANCDGKINIKDATYVQKSLANIVKADTLSTTVSDYNRDGKVTIKDATAIQKRIAGL